MGKEGRILGLMTFEDIPHLQQTRKIKSLDAFLVQKPPAASHSTLLAQLPAHSVLRNCCKCQIPQYK
jgi:hypothetical protein